MVSALHCLSYVSAVVGLIFVLLSLASGLLYIAEVIEEHSALAKTTGKRLIYCIIVFYGLLYWVDDLPAHLVAVGIAGHFVYLTNFRKSWPTISLTSVSFVLSCGFVLLSHYLSFRHFSAKQATANHHYGRYNAYNHRKGASYGGKKHDEGFLEVATFFAVCVWLVPFYLFLSLSANDNVLPSAGETPGPARRTSAAAPNSPSLVPPQSPTLGRHQRQRSSMMKTALSSAFSIVPSALRPSALSSNLHPVPVSTGSASRNDSSDRLLRSPSPSIGFQPFGASSATSRGGAGSQRDGLLVSSSPTTSSFFSSGQPPPWGSPAAASGPSSSQPSSPSLGASFPPPGGRRGGGGGGFGLGMGIGSNTSPALRALNPPGMPPRRHTTAGDEATSFVSATTTTTSIGGNVSPIGRGFPPPSTNRNPLATSTASGPVKRRGTGTGGEQSSLR